MATEEIVDRLGEYASKLATASRVADRDSLARAADLEALYEAREWVEPWLEVVPLKPDATGRTPAADNRTRFAAWLANELEARHHVSLARQTVSQLFTARRIIKAAFPQVRTDAAPAASVESEGAVRPLAWMLRYQFDAQVPTVMARAVELAGGGQVTETHVRTALAEWKKENRGESLTRAKSSRAQIHYSKATTAVYALADDHDDEKWRKFVELVKRLDDQR